MNPIKSITHNGYKIEIFPDELGESPREWDNIGIMVCFHNRYELGDKTEYRSDNYNGWDELKDDILSDNSGSIILPLYLLDHSGLAMSTGSFHNPWDSGQVGFIYTSRAKIKEGWGWGKLTKYRRDKIIECLNQEVKTYNQYLNGDIYGYRIKDQYGNTLDSCWGYYGMDYCIKEAMAGIEFIPAPPIPALDSVF